MKKRKMVQQIMLKLDPAHIIKTQEGRVQHRFRVLCMAVLLHLMALITAKKSEHRNIGWTILLTKQTADQSPASQEYFMM